MSIAALLAYIVVGIDAARIDESDDRIVSQNGRA
jgi:hypothetical protein